MEWIVHLCKRQAWQAAQDLGEYQADSLALEGFIHFSRPAQVLEVANRLYQAEKDLLLLWIDPHRLRAELRWEQADGQVFPHLYGPLNLDAVLKVSAFRAGADGIYNHLPAMPG